MLTAIRMTSTFLAASCEGNWRT